MRTPVKLSTSLAASLTLALLFGHSPLRAECTVSEVRTDTEQTVTLENSFVRMSVDLLHGGKVTSFLYKPLNREWLVSGQALFIDHVWQQVWPGELYSVPYEYELLHRGPDRVAVKVWRTLEGRGNAAISGVRVERTLTLTADSPAVVAEVTLSNPTDAVKAVGYWAQHIFRLGGLGDNYYVRPFTGGLSVATLAVDARGRERVGQEFVKDPTAGWTATLNALTGEAAVFLMDYNDLRWLYNCIGVYTTEWYYDLLRMAPGREWTTRFTLLPLSGYRGVSHASHRVVADVRTARSAEGDRLVYTLGCGERPLRDVRLTASVRTAEPGARPVRERVTVGDLDHHPVEIVSELTLPPGRTPLIVEVSLRGPGLSESFTRYLSAEDRAHPRLVAGVFESGYHVPPPPKHKVIEQPATVARVPREGTAVLEVRGQFFPAWRLEEALAGLGQYTLQPSHFTSNVYGDQIDYFPPSLEDAMALDAVVLSNIPAEALGAEGEALLREYVRHGGGLLVLGGWYAFGGGQYAGSALAELLPVISGAPFDIRWHRPGLELKAAGSGALPGLQPGPGLQVLWMHEVPSLRPGAQVPLTAGDRPFLVTGTYGQGRVACILGTPSGVAGEGGELFCESAAWPRLLGRILEWLKTGK